MARKNSMLAPQWWDYTTLDDEILNDAAKLTVEDMAGLGREGFKVVFYDSPISISRELIRQSTSRAGKVLAAWLCRGVRVI